MAIIDNRTIQSEDGIKKEIDEQSKDIVFDILQRGIYAFPVKSTVRELVSNAHDAIIERNTAKAIIKGEDSVDDHFDTSIKTETIYHSSGFDRDYYDLDWLSDDNNVYIDYIENENKDVLSVTDNGIGLGKDRLIGYFSLNWSSKRTNKDTLGRWGLGSKVALSLGVDSFRVTNRYNGKKFVFDVYLNKIESIVPRINENGKFNEYILIKDEYKAYWEPTTEKNGVTVSTDIRKFEKNRLFEAVKAQLMYIDDVVFRHKPKDSLVMTSIDISAEIVYKDNDILISKNNVYDKPHILLGAPGAYINYGLVAFPELELETRKGAVGLIMNINDIEVTPSREAAVWSQKTRKAILVKYTKIVETATNYINSLVKNETDYLIWITTISNIKSGDVLESDPILKAFSSIISLRELSEFTFAPNPLLPKVFIYKHNKSFLRLRTISFNSWNNKIEREPIQSMGSIAGLPIYKLEKGKVSRYKDKYILDCENVNRFVLMEVLDSNSLTNPERAIYNTTLSKSYDNIELTDEELATYAAIFDGTDDNDDNDDATLLANSKVDHEAIRKANKEIVMSVYNNGVFSANNYKIASLNSMFLGHKDNIKFYYGLGTERDDMKFLGEFLPQTSMQNVRADLRIDVKHSWEVKQYLNHKISHSVAKFPDIYMLLVSKQNETHLSSLKNMPHISELILLNYNKKRKKVSFTTMMKYEVTAFAALKYIADISNDTTGSIKSALFYNGRISRFLKEYFNREDEDKYIYFNLLRYTGNSMNSHNTISKFISGCYTLGINELLNIDFDRGAVLDSINENVPPILADKVLKIEEVDIIDKDLFITLVRELSFYTNNKNMWRNLNYNIEDKYIKELVKMIDFTIIHNVIETI